MNIHWTRHAISDLIEIRAFVARDRPLAAQRLSGRIQHAVGLLAEYPLLGRIGREPGTRELVVSRTPYIVVYQLRPDAVDVMRVLHGAQRWPLS